MGIIGDITGKTCIVNDDMIDTAGTLCASVLKLKEMGAGDIMSAQLTASSRDSPLSA